ncbi:hypothetical protein GCM10022295_93480 [Streptomyces osmaniensis]|uniref:Uncharacterized protein n=1 Tax=Streptomyces osmaniensis TaxID=593134 RepID=A0ABP6Z7X9_9ACTN
MADGQVGVAGGSVPVDRVMLRVATGHMAAAGTDLADWGSIPPRAVERVKAAADRAAAQALLAARPA